ncbi:MAG: prepilin-type N-terminal cleavage/methylation domain-containing protein [Methylacidiphilales bacterium]|nr:prepilin-type N-terminal cleavage/methylation domain-containing protein [Candidatus Methylacidiphilales bacterium]
MKTGRFAFTLIELLVVITIIAILSGLVLGVAGNVNRKAGTSRAKAEIMAIDLALERYKTDNGDYPSTSFITISNGIYTGNPSAYIGTSPTLGASTPGGSGGCLLFTYLMGRSSFQTSSTSQTSVTSGYTQYMELKSNQVGAPMGSSYIQDPFGYAYGYFYKYDAAIPGDSNASDKSLFNSVQPDVWSTAGQTATASSTVASGTATTYAVYLNWVKNWGSQ